VIVYAYAKTISLHSPNVIQSMTPKQLNFHYGTNTAIENNRKVEYTDTDFWEAVKVCKNNRHFKIIQSQIRCDNDIPARTLPSRFSLS
jgi:hypothetical protein